jgi:hypothetical protein
VEQQQPSAYYFSIVGGCISLIFGLALAGLSLFLVVFNPYGWISPSSANIQFAMNGVIASLAGVGMIIAGAMLYRRPRDSNRWGLLSIISSIAGAFGLFGAYQVGGYAIFGPILGLIGGVLGILTGKPRPTNTGQVDHHE